MKKRKQRRSGWLILLVVLLLTIPLGGYWAYTRYMAPREEVGEPALQTATVRKGDIVITAIGSGNLLPAEEVDLSFRTSGVVAEVLVSVGEYVEAGTPLARLETAALERSVAQAEIALRQAEIRLEAARAPAENDALQRAQDTIDQAAASLRLAQLNYEGVQNSTAVNEALANAQAAYDGALGEYNYRLRVYNESGADGDYWFLENAQTCLAEAQLALDRARQQADQQIQAASNDLARAADAYQQAQRDLEALLASPAEDDLESLSLDLESARMNLEAAQENLANATLLAPFSGVVTAIQAQVGAMAGTTTPIATLADMEPLLVRFYLEESDLGRVAVDNRVTVTFDAWPDDSFPGAVIRVDPALVTVDGTPAVQAWAALEVDEGQRAQLLAGLTAEVEVVAGEVYGALLVPIHALRELAPGQYAVMVVQPDGGMQVRPVQVGLMDFTNAEIISGLEQGEVVSTGTVETE